MRTILSFDYGHRKIGLAVGNDSVKTATELTTVSSKDGAANWAVLDKIISEWQPSLLLLGLPLNMDGSESEFCKQVRLFGEQLKNRYNLAVDYEDERLSSNHADSFIRQSLNRDQRASKKLQTKRDQIAARLILESFLNRNE